MIALLLASSLAAPVPKAKAEPYFPTREGAKMVFEYPAGRETKEVEQTVTRVASERGTHTVTVETKAFGGVMTGEQVVSGDGITSKLGDQRTKTFQPAAGSTWTEQVSGRGKTEFTVGKEVEVKVPAGTYAAIPVACVDEHGTRMTTWYAQGVGPVKMELDGQVVMELKAFTPGK